jgi:peptidoglycan/LPS O-acetylase OafA/YrhL
VLSHSYELKISSGALSFKRYILLRLARLSPLHFAIALPFIAFGMFEGTLSLLPALANLTYLQSWFPHSSMYFSLNAPSWSLSNEMFFYFSFYFLTVLSLGRLIKFTIILFLLVLFAACIITVFIDGEKLFGSNNTFAHWMFYIFPGFRLLEFMAGMMMFRVWRNGFLLHRHFTPISYILLFMCMFIAESVPESFRMSLFFLPAIALFLYAHLSEGTYASRFYSSRFIVLLGNASFAFYLIHQPLIKVLRNVLTTFTLDDFSFFAISFVVISLLSIGTHLTYKKWAERKLKYYITKLTSC